MGIFRREKKAAVTVQTRPAETYNLPRYLGERGLYRTLRESVPILDAAIYKIRRLVGTFTVHCEDELAEQELKVFLREIPVGGALNGIQAFLGTFLEDLLTYGNAVGEIVLSGNDVAAIYNASLGDVEIIARDPLTAEISTVRFGEKVVCKYPELILFSALNPVSGSVSGTSILQGLPFVSEILMKIYKSIGVNWDRFGNVRFAVTCTPDGSGGIYAAEQAKQVAEQWKKAMRSTEVSDFIAVGDVSIKAIGADQQILESEVPVRQMLEQIVAKMGIPPFLLGLAWSSTERMSSQQADILTSELDAYRELLAPIIRKICKVFLMLRGYSTDTDIVWDEITLQDEVDHANARYLTAKARQIELELKQAE